MAVADLISIIAMLASAEDSRESLAYCLKGTKKDIISLGQEYLRHLSGEIGQDYNIRVSDGKDTRELMEIVDAIVPHFMNNNEEPEAVDLLMEVEALENLPKFTTAANFDRVARYLLSLANYAADPQEMAKAFKTTYEIYMKHERFTDAMKVA